MALYSILRKASSSVLPLAVRAARASINYHATISSAAATATATATSTALQKSNLRRKLTRGSFIPFLSFSSESQSKHSADEKLLRVIESEIDCAEETESTEAVEDIPKQFPFEIEDNPGERTILLTRKFEDEIIKVEVDLPHLSTGYEDDDNAEEEEEERADDLSIPLVVSISKGNGVELEFGVTALTDEITIDSLSIKQPEAYEGRLAYEGPEFSDLDENLQKAFHNYLEVRGIGLRTANFLHQYMAAKDSNEYINWLKNLKNFVEH